MRLKKSRHQSVEHGSIICFASLATASGKATTISPFRANDVARLFRFWKWETRRTE